MEVVVVENIYLLVIVTLISVLQNGEEQPEQWQLGVFRISTLVCFFSILCPESGEGMQQSKQQSRSFWEGFLCQVRASILITSFTWICLFFLWPVLHFRHFPGKVDPFDQPEVFFFLQFSVQHVGLPVATHCNSSERLTFTARLGLSFSFPTLQAAGSRCMQSPASWAHVFGFIHESQHTGGVGWGGGGGTSKHPV